MSADLHVSFECDAFDPADVQVHEVSGVEECSQLFHFHLVLVARDRAAVDVDAMVTGACALVFTRRDEEVRRLHGMIASVQDVALTEARDYTAWRVHFVPRAFRTTLSETIDIFLEMNVQELIEKKLKGVGLRPGDDVEFRLSKKYPKREFVVQYQETDHNFIARQAEHYGITYFFEHGARDKIVFTDTNEVLKPIAGGGTAPWQAQNVNEMGGLRVYALESETRALPGKYVVRDYNYRTPGQDLKASATVLEGAAGEVVEYGTHFKTPEEGQRFAKVRAEELLATRWTFTGKSNVPTLAAGETFTIEEHPRGDVALLLTRVDHFARQAVLGMPLEMAQPYENNFTAIPKEVTFRPQRRAPKPIVPGVVTGIVDTATKSNYADVDDEGRYRVKFMYDTAQRGEAQASRPVRMAQPHSGPGYGMHFPLRGGIEVLLTCVNGDPDRPVIMGTVPNPATASPVAKGNAARNIIRTGGGNEMNFDDTEGSHRLKISIPHSDTTFQLGAPNSPEDGAMLATSEAWSAVAGQAATTVSNATNLFAATAKFFASSDITAYAGVSNKLNKWDAVPDLVNAASDFTKDTVNQTKNWRDIKSKEAAARQKVFTGETLRTGRELARARDERVRRIETATRTRDEAVRARDQNAAICNSTHPGVAPGGWQGTPQWSPGCCCEHYLYRAQRAAEAETNLTNETNAANTAVTNATTNDTAAKGRLNDNAAQTAEALDAASIASDIFEADESTLGHARRYTAATADTVKNLSSSVKKVMGKDGLLPSIKALLSARSGAAAIVAGVGAAGKVMAHLAAATAAGALPRISGTGGPIMKSWNIQGASGTAALFGDVNAVVAGPLASLVGERIAIVGSVGKTLVHSTNAAEVTGGVKLFLTSKVLIDAKSDVRVKTHSGAATQMKAVGPFTAQTSAAMNLKATGPMTLKSNPLVNVKATDIKLKASAGIQAKAANVKVDASEKIKMKAGQKAEIVVGGYKAEVTTSKVQVGSSASHARFVSGQALVKQGGTSMKLTGSAAAIKGPQVKISGSGGVKVTGAKIDLG